MKIIAPYSLLQVALRVPPGDDCRPALEAVKFDAATSQAFACDGFMATRQPVIYDLASGEQAETVLVPTETFRMAAKLAVPGSILTISRVAEQWALEITTKNGPHAILFTPIEATFPDLTRIYDEVPAAGERIVVSATRIRDLAEIAIKSRKRNSRSAEPMLVIQATGVTTAMRITTKPVGDEPSEIVSDRVEMLLMPLASNPDA
ncbi:MAG: hypothetical protein M3Y45_05315 [Actinomycetota bacterium]|nr:hypothetical protein [Actinomycetota bacterium]